MCSFATGRRQSLNPRARPLALVTTGSGGKLSRSKRINTSSAPPGPSNNKAAARRATKMGEEDQLDRAKLRLLLHGRRPVSILANKRPARRVQLILTLKPGGIYASTWAPLNLHQQPGPQSRRRSIIIICCSYYYHRPTSTTTFEFY